MFSGAPASTQSAVSETAPHCLRPPPGGIQVDASRSVSYVPPLDEPMGSCNGRAHTKQSVGVASDCREACYPSTASLDAPEAAPCVPCAGRFHLSLRG